MRWKSDCIAATSPPPAGRNRTVSPFFNVARAFFLDQIFMMAAQPVGRRNEMQGVALRREAPSRKSGCAMAIKRDGALAHRLAEEIGDADIR